MDLTDEFHKHASDCEAMAKLTRDPESKAQWKELAQRFRHCAEKTNTPAIKASDVRTRVSKVRRRAFSSEHAH
jgi:hypothetical protein